MTAGFFWRVPGKASHYVYTDVAAQKFLEADFKGAIDEGSLRDWDLVPTQDKIALLILRADEKEKEDK